MFTSICYEIWFLCVVCYRSFVYNQYLLGSHQGRLCVWILLWSTSDSNVPDAGKAALYLVAITGAAATLPSNMDLFIRVYLQKP